MSLPTASSLQTLDSAFGAEPFVGIAAKSGIDTNGLEYASGTEPFIAQGVSGGGGGGGGSALSNFLAL